MKLAPSAALCVPMLTHFPLAFAIDLHSRRITDQMTRLDTVLDRQLDVQLQQPPRKGRMIRHRQTKLHHLKDRSQHPFSLSVSLSEQILQNSQRLNGRVGVNGRSASLTRLLFRRPVLNKV